MASRIGIIGAGSWGTALAKLLADKGEDVVMWAFETDIVDAVNHEHRNNRYLSDIPLPSTLRATTDLAEALQGKEFVLSVVPAQFVRTVWSRAARHLGSDTILISCTKGIEQDTQKLISVVLEETLPNHPTQLRVVLSGPSFASEVAHNLPTSVTITGIDGTITRRAQQLMRTPTFLTFTHSDVIGVEIGGAVKNVIAIATGASDGLGYGHNARAALITRGLYEIIKIGQQRGADPHTFMGLAGVGDLVLTATDTQSRNYTVGFRLGRGERIGDIIAGMTMVAEGYYTSVAVQGFVTEHGITAPICTTVYRMLHESLKPRDAASKLCSMSLDDELRSVKR